MRILLDECVPVQVARTFSGHEVHSATDPRWRGASNGELLRLAEETGFDLIVVADKNMRHQQNLSGRCVAILELWTNHRPTLERHLHYITAATKRTAPGQYLELTAPPAFSRNMQEP
jgi:hypothetical protein